jgi:hypothetical protein
MFAGCSSGHRAPARVTHPLPSHLTPSGATVGFFSDLVKNDKDACTFAAEGATPFCLLALEATTSTFADLGVGQVTVKGTEALVTVTGRFCVTAAGSTNCTTNTNPRTGQPGSSGNKSFDSLYKTAVKGVAINKGAVPCERIKSEWYVSLST